MGHSKIDNSKWGEKMPAEDWISSKLWKKHVRNFENRFTDKGKAPRAKDWKPIRIAMADSILVKLVLRHQWKGNYLEIDVCDINNHFALEPEYYSTQVALSNILSEAFQSGGTMMIRFTKNVGRGRIPSEVRDVADMWGIDLKHNREGIIMPNEARELYLMCSELSDECKKILLYLHLKKRVSLERSLYMLHGGMWPMGVYQHILQMDHYPDNVLLGKFQPEDGVLYEQQLAVARNALFGGYLDQRLSLQLEYPLGEEDFTQPSPKDIFYRLKVGYDYRFNAKVFQAPEPLSIPWLEYSDKELTLQPRQKLYARVVCMHVNNLSKHFDMDIEMATQMLQTAREENHGHADVICAIFVSWDFKELDEERKNDFISRAHSAGLEIIQGQIPMRIASFNAGEKLENSSGLRR